MNMIHIAIVEDEALYIRQLKDFIQRYQKEQGKQIKVTVFPDGEDIIENYQGEFDIILMDIQMKFMDGMTAAEKIRKLDQEVIIMFITNMVQYAVKGYEVDAMDYILKPVEYFAFSQKLGKAIARITRQTDTVIMVPTTDGIQKLTVSDIFYIESRGHNALYRTTKGIFISRAVLKDLEESMKQHGFFRCGKGYLVNMKRVDGVSGNDCIISGEKIPISRIKKKEFMECLMQYMNKE